MTSERVIQAHLDRERARRETAARTPEPRFSSPVFAPLW
jgi:hypothetical protein